MDIVKSHFSIPCHLKVFRLKVVMNNLSDESSVMGFEMWCVKHFCCKNAENIDLF